MHGLPVDRGRQKPGRCVRDLAIRARGQRVRGVARRADQDLGLDAPMAGRLVLLLGGSCRCLRQLDAARDRNALDGDQFLGIMFEEKHGRPDAGHYEWRILHQSGRERMAV